ncbi:cuticle protein 19-like isoform X2 [Tribolium madens]|uniref:cuticle protein 19-like isoform X2 n=1 Tax=Tribolium madens TaxID=41895 RepID=UPI001CF75AC9|nr:cuticle protein 19-like isoform X2 [Tribolium madens]
MTFITNTLNLGIVLLTIVSVDNRCCNGLNEVSYTFRYAIDEARVVTQHWEERRSDIVHGSYSFLEADGKIRVVEYQVNGKAGFRAVVTFRKPPTVDFFRLPHSEPPEVSRRLPTPVYPCQAGGGHQQ